MAIGVIWAPEVDQQFYNAISERVMPGAADKGMRFHAAGPTDGGWRIVEVWDSREALENFIRDDLAPAIDEVSQGQAPTPEPDTVFEVYRQQ